MARKKFNCLRIRRTESMITIIGVPDVPGAAAGLFMEMAREGIPITMIVQNAPDAGSASITFTVSKDDLEKALAVSRAVVERLEAEGLMNDDHIARLSVIGTQLLEDTVGVAGELFSVLAEERINVLAINTTADVISCIIVDACLDRAADILCARFGLSVETIE